MHRQKIQQQKQFLILILFIIHYCNRIKIRKDLEKDYYFKVVFRGNLLKRCYFFPVKHIIGSVWF